MTGYEDQWKLLCVVLGYHIHKDVWDPYLEDDKHQRCNPCDKYTIDVLLVIAWPSLSSGHTHVLCSLINEHVIVSILSGQTLFHSRESLGTRLS